MARFLKLLPLLFCGLVYAQEEKVQSVYFGSGKFNIDEKQGQEIVDFIKNTDSTRIESVEIFGYTDDLGKEAYNYKLSTNRAKAVANWLVSKGVTSNRVQYKGYGWKYPIQPNTTPDGKKKNQRVEVKILTMNG